MRMLGLALLVVSVLLGTGGVAVHSSADAPGAKTAGSADPGQCTAADAAPAIRPGVRPSPLAPAASGASQVIILNTRGHNYPRPGDVPATPVEVLPAAPGETPADPQ